MFSVKVIIIALLISTVVFIIYEQKAWEVAQAPFKNLLMMGFMMWMAGNTVHLFSIGITFSALWQPISALQGVGKGKPTIRSYLLIHSYGKGWEFCRG